MLPQAETQQKPCGGYCCFMECSMGQFCNRWMIHFPETRLFFVWTTCCVRITRHRGKYQSVVLNLQRSMQPLLRSGNYINSFALAQHHWHFRHYSSLHQCRCTAGHNAARTATSYRGRSLSRIVPSTSVSAQECECAAQSQQQWIEYYWLQVERKHRSTQSLA